MKLSYLLSEVEIQSEKTIVYYDEQKNERVEIPCTSEDEDYEILYMYVENNVLFIEVPNPNEVAE